MSITIQIPTPLRRFTSEQGEVQVDGATVGEALTALTEQFPNLRRHLYTDDGTLRSFVNVFLNDEDVRHMQSSQTPVAQGDTLVIIPSIAGGAVLEAETETLPSLTPAEIRHYSRHLIMPEVGTAGQRKLKAAKVLMIGTGGLGSPLGLYLAAAGVGTLGLVDFDVVDLTNLQRQLLHGTKDVGRPKLYAARERIEDVNPNGHVEPYQTRLASADALEILRNYHFLL